MEHENKEEQNTEDYGILYIKYRDKDGNIHKIKWDDHEGFYKMMCDRTNQLIFD